MTTATVPEAEGILARVERELAELRQRVADLEAQASAADRGSGRHDTGDWLLIGEAAAIARLSESSIRWLVQSGQLASAKAGRRRRIRRVDLVRFLEGGRR